MSLRLRIAAAAGAAVTVAVIGAAVIVYFAVRSELRGEVADALRNTASSLIQRGPGGDTTALLPLFRSQGGVPPTQPFGGAPGYVQLILPSGSVVRPQGTTSSLPVEKDAAAIARTGTGEMMSDLEVRGTHLRVYTVGAGGVGALQVARPLDEVDRELRNMLAVLIAVGIGGVALAIGLGMLVARAALRPISRFTARSEELTDDPDVSQRIDVKGKDELARLAASFNRTLDALERSVETQRQLVADASHELRTPIASLRTNIQVLEEAHRLSPQERENLRDDIIEELDELTELVADVVELARGSAAGTLVDDVRLDHIVASAVDRARRRSGDAVKFEVSAEPSVVKGEPDRISRAVINLLDNARKWSSPGGVVEVELRNGTLAVRDHGNGFDANDLPHVFDRFYRADTSRGMPGSGLGLAIVRQAAEAHGGYAKAANARDGGAVLTVNFGATAAPETEPAPPQTSDRVRR